MQNKDMLAFLKRVTHAQQDIQRIGQLLLYLREKEDVETLSFHRNQDAEKYRNVHTEEPLWFIIFGTVISAFLPALLIVWSYYYMRFESVEYMQLPQMISTAAILAIICGVVRIGIASLRKLEAGRSTLKKYISAAEYTNNLTKNAVCRALDIMKIPENQKEPCILSAVYQYFIHHKNTTFENALASYEQPYPSETNSIRPAPAVIYFYLHQAKRNANKLIKMSSG